jgi:CRISPR-associated exonuclease Cas4
VWSWLPTTAIWERQRCGRLAWVSSDGPTLVRSGDALIPVEQKPSARRIQPSHVMQVAAQCLLVEEVYGVRPPFGIVVLADGIREKVPFTPKLERRLLQTMADMRDLIATETEPGPRWVAPKCRACSFVETCWE